MEIMQNPLLLDDFPEAIYPLLRLENNARRQGGQHIAGELTLAKWGNEKLVFPTVEGPTCRRRFGPITKLARHRGRSSR